MISNLLFAAAMTAAAPAWYMWIRGGFRFMPSQAEAALWFAAGSLAGTGLLLTRHWGTAAWCFLNALAAAVMWWRRRRHRNVARLIGEKSRRLIAVLIRRIQPVRKLRPLPVPALDGAS